MTKGPILTIMAAAVLAPVALPAAAQTAPINGIVYLYKATDRCPTDSNGNEIVVCVRRSPNEELRIPKDLRDKTLKPEYRSFAARNAENTANTADVGNLACSNTGIGGAAGCTGQLYDSWRRERAALRAEKQVDLPK